MSKISYRQFSQLGKNLKVLNWVLSYINHTPVENQSILSDVDYNYLEHFFRTSQMIDLIKAYEELENRKKQFSQMDYWLWSEVCFIPNFISQCFFMGFFG